MLGRRERSLRKLKEGERVVDSTSKKNLSSFVFLGLRIKVLVGNTGSSLPFALPNHNCNISSIISPKKRHLVLRHTRRLPLLLRLLQLHLSSKEQTDHCGLHPLRVSLTLMAAYLETMDSTHLVFQTQKVMSTLTSSKELLILIKNIDKAFHSKQTGPGISTVNELSRFAPSIREQLKDWEDGLCESNADGSFLHENWNKDLKLFSDGEDGGQQLLQLFILRAEAKL